MREIKFRAWDGYRMRYLEGEGYVCISKCSWGFWEADKPLTGTGLSDDDIPGVLMQFTGLKDKNGVEIYEGDVLSDGDSCFVVKFDAPAFEMERLSGSYQFPYFRSRASGFEVIGNIYENPELLATKAEAA